MKQILKTVIQPIHNCLLLLFLALASLPALGQGNDSKGRDFWLMFNGNLSSPALTLFITSEVNTTGTVEIPGMGFSVPFTVTANTVTPVSIPVAAAQHTSNVVDNKGIHVTASHEVTVYGLNYAPFTTDAYLGLPTDVLGTDYIVTTYSGQNRSQFGVVATVNGTVVTITPSVASSGRPAGVPYNITMNRGQTYELGFASDLTGTIITSTQPIGVFGSNACANIPPGAVFCDHIVEMLPPTTAWGRKFGTVPLSSRTNGDTWRFMAAENGTVISINGVAQPAVNRGQHLERILTTQSVIESNKPIFAAQYANGSGFSGNPGDPFMMNIPPLEQFLARYTVTTVSGYVEHFINILAPTSIVGSLTLDGAVVPAASFTPIGSSGFSGAKIAVSPGTHNLQGSLPFGVFMYGFNRDDSYGYPGGQSFSAVATVNSVTLTPATGSGTVGTNQCFNALVRDQFSNPVPGVRVDFGISGANPGASGFAFTNAAGVAQFCYTGANSGNDNIVASVGSLSDNSTFDWNNVVANVYYSKAAGNLHNVLTWGVNPDGSGANPTDFGAGKTFNLANRPGVYTMTGNWTVSGILNNPAGSQLQIGNFTLSLVDMTGTGNLAGNAMSNLVITGTSASPFTLRFTSAGNTLRNLTINRSSGPATTLATTLNIIDVLNVQAGTFNTGNRLVLKSSAANTARVAPVGGSIIGQVTVERYIPARRAWRLMNAPVTGSQTVNQAWQEGVTTASPNPNPNPGFGTHITGGPVIGTVANGFDQNPGARSSLLRYNSATASWRPIPNTNANPVGMVPYMLFVRGHRGILLNGVTTPPTPTVLRAKGNLAVGNQTFPVSATGFTAIPNPFASPINFATLTRFNVQNNFYLWDPKMGGVHGVGAYVNISWNGSSYDVTPASVSPESQYIQSGQSFLVRSTGVAGSITIKESDKSATPAMDVFRAAGSRPAPIKGLRVTLQTTDDALETNVLDEVFSSHSARYSDGIDALDARKLANQAENLAIVRDGQELMVDRRSPLAEEDIIRLRLWNTEQRSYVLEFNPIDLATSGYTAFLEDRYLGISTPIDLGVVSQIFFSVTTDPASASPERFQVVLTSKKTRTDWLTQNGKRVITAYPNPVTGSSINLHFINESGGTYRLTLVNSIGQVVLRKDIQHAGGTFIQRLDLDRKLPKGVYQLQVRSKEGQTNLPILSQ